MEHLSWLLAGLFALVALWQFSAARSAYRKLNTLNEYVQFLLFQPKVYGNHREKFLGFLAQKSTASVSDQTMASYQAIENMAIQLEGEILLANVASRVAGGGQDAKTTDGPPVSVGELRDAVEIPSDAMEIIGAFGKVVAEHFGNESNQFTISAPVLPYSKESINQAIETALKHAKDPQMRQSLVRMKLVLDHFVKE